MTMERTFKSRSLANRASPMLALVIPAALAGVSFASYGAAAAPQTAETLVAKAETALKSGQADKAIAPAEAAVAADPLNADTRALLGAAYLGAGRFMAAAATFEDALDLGHEDSRTVLSFALAKTAIGDARVAVAALDEARTRLSAADYGLALALAGQADRGVKVLVDAVRFEEATPKLRQNLAYAYALAGNWRAARVMAAEDVPAGQVDARMVEWAATAAPDQFQQRRLKQRRCRLWLRPPARAFPIVLPPALPRTHRVRRSRGLIPLRRAWPKRLLRPRQPRKAARSHSFPTRWCKLCPAPQAARPPCRSAGWQQPPPAPRRLRQSAHRHRHLPLLLFQQHARWPAIRA
jgi:tetratricopeptide (TPR) repeat protein